MTPEKQNEEIHKHLGWVFHEGEEPRYGGSYKNRGWVHPDGSWKTFIPNYQASIDRMLIAVQCLTPQERDIFGHLMSIPDDSPRGSTYEFTPLKPFDLLNQPASKWAKCFLRAVGKWEE